MISPLILFSFSFQQKIRKKSLGFSMLEVLISLTLMAVAMLGAASMQLNSLKMSKGAYLRTQAVFLSAEIAERIESNKTAAIAGSYVTALSSTASSASVNCATTDCTATQLASYDLAQWSTQVTSTLKGASWQITQTSTVNVAPASYTIVLNWQDRRDKTTYSDTGSVENFSYTSSRIINE